jgi:hypothetical protein
MQSSEYEYDEYNISDDESEFDDVYYEPEEMSATRFNISICELYNKKLHGNADNMEVLYHYLIYERYKKLNLEYINLAIENIKNEYNNLNNKNHDIFRNYREIVNNFNYIKPEITECIYLNTNHCIAIIKTIWLRLIQRKWKSICKERKLCISMRCRPNSLKYKEIYGKWPNNCLNYPGIKGMLSELSRSSSR